MRMNIMFGLDHAEHEDLTHFEAARLLADLADKPKKEAPPPEGESFV